MEFVAVALLVALGTLSQGQPIRPQAFPSLCPPLPPRDCQDVHAGGGARGRRVPGVPRGGRGARARLLRHEHRGTRVDVCGRGAAGGAGDAEPGAADPAPGVPLAVPAPPPPRLPGRARGGAREDGVYLVSPGGGGAPVPVYCDMSTEGHVWTVFQRRFNGSVSFFRGWNDYRAGFGRADGEYWLGLQSLALLTLQGRYELRVELEDFENNSASATYGSFALSPTAVSADEDGYTLHVAGFVDGGAGDSLSYHNGQKFSTFDRDQDLFAQNCAALSSGAWWFRSCHFSNLNVYLAGPHLSYANGINWAQWKGFYFLKRSEMKIRRL
ncbi:LOW QUALITY PROTEIN: microfibril-associated glycoprotein 4-like [Ammospiza maritima maritima]